ncbi:hypothetical protein IJJ08_05010 [bacterium]|nr:hypothetical protein [bacterium]
MSRCYGRVFLAAIFLLAAGRLAWAGSGNKTKKLSELAAGQVVRIGGVSFVKTANNQLVATSLCPQGSTYSSFYKGCVVKTTDFAYTGGEQTFAALADHYYVLEVWGASGGSAPYSRGGYGGYSIGVYNSQQNINLYLTIGGIGTDSQAGYNGGGLGKVGTVNKQFGYGGGASHVARRSGQLLTLIDYQDSILIVAGAGAGAADYHRSSVVNNGIGGDGGGWIGRQGGRGGSDGYLASGGNQTNAGYSEISESTIGSFGSGGNGKPNNSSAGGGGGGFYGGGGGYCSGGGGGSGYIGSSALLSLTNFPKHMTCYECLESTDSATLTFSSTCASETPTADCAKVGNGHARITQLSVYLGI